MSGRNRGSRDGWTRLADFEFDLPPIREQQLLANALSASSIASGTAVDVAECADSLVDATAHVLFGGFYARALIQQRLAPD